MENSPYFIDLTKSDDERELRDPNHDTEAAK